MENWRNERNWHDDYWLVLLPPGLLESWAWRDFFGLVFETKGLISKYSEIRTYVFAMARSGLKRVKGVFWGVCRSKTGSRLRCLVFPPCLLYRFLRIARNSGESL